MASAGVDALLRHSVDDSAASQYYSELVDHLQCPVQVRLDAGGGKGKGVFATRRIEAGETIFEELPMAGTQHAANRAEALLCGHCFRPIGTVERDVGAKLCALIGRLEHGDHDDDGGSRGGGSSEDDGDAVLERARRAERVQAAVDAARLEALMAGGAEEQLPHARQLVPLPEPVPCAGGCAEQYCSDACAADAWRRQHCLLCPVGAAGAPSEEAGKCKAPAAPAPAPQGERRVRHAKRGAGGSGSRAAAASAPPPELVDGVPVRRARLAAFYEHADETNDAFRVAAQLVAATALEASRLLMQKQRAADTADADTRRRDALLEAWRPVSLGHKAPWWDAAAAARSGGGADADALRAQLRELAADSLSLLRAALLPEDDGDAAGEGSSFPELFDLEVYASLIGMFELNNLALASPSPAGAYWRAVSAAPQQEGGVGSGGEGLPAAARAAAREAVAPLFEALEDDAHVGGEGTAFYALQSCINHSCAPNAAARASLARGGFALVALRALEAGEEVSISYIDDDDGVDDGDEEAGEGRGWRARAEALRDYGFECGCELCAAELAAELALPGSGKGDDDDG